MPDNWLVSDDELRQAVKEAVLEAQTTPPRLVHAARAAYAWHTLDAELTALAYDSALLTSSALPVASQPALREDEALLRYLTFVATDLTVEMEVDDVRLLGQIVPPRPGRLEVWTAESTGRCIGIDAFGCFCISPLPARPFRLHVRTADGTRVRTAWIRLRDDAPTG